MASIVKTLTNTYDDFVAQADPRITSWPFMSSPMPTVVLIASYLLFVIVIGPSFMQKKKPYNLQFPMFVYNISLVIINTGCIIKLFLILLEGSESLHCKHDPGTSKIAKLGWIYFILKFVEFFDTIFFILRKKNSQVTFLHIFHHSIMPFIAWNGLRIAPVGYNYIGSMVNTTIHIVMYLYYGLSALGPKFQKYLWWKKYLTLLQLVQFVTIFMYALVLLLSDCDVPRTITNQIFFCTAAFFVMFSIFFGKTYKTPKTKNK